MWATKSLVLPNSLVISRARRHYHHSDPESPNYFTKHPSTAPHLQGREGI